MENRIGCTWGDEKARPGVIVVEEEFVIVHGRFSGFGLPVNWIAAGIIRMKDGVLARGVLQSLQIGFFSSRIFFLVYADTLA
jgi:hypothetical protein